MTNLDDQLQLLAETHDVPVTKLKTVYLRGVKDFIDKSLVTGTASMHGLARVSQFIENSSATDKDLETREPKDIAPDGVEFSLDSSEIVVDVCYNEGARVAELFKPGITSDIRIDSDFIEVWGTLDKLAWHYELNLSSGRFIFGIS